MAGNQVRIGTQVAGVGKASSDLDRLRDKFDKLQKQGAKGFAIGAGAAITAKGMNLVGQAASDLVGAIGDATQAAIADEESQNRLGASLRSNVPAWAVNTAAIERNIKAKQRLGFDDETLRDSLTVLVGATNSVSEAERIMATAMDLARFKGIDLRTASEALIKVEGGHYRALAQLGIKLREGATSTEALAAVQKVAAGQAEAYAETAGGKATAATIALDEAMEGLGQRSIPLVIEGAKALTYALDRTAVPLEDLERAARGGSQGAAAQFRQLERVAAELGVSVARAWELAAGAGSLSIDDIKAHLAELTTEGTLAMQNMNRSTGGMGDALEALAVRSKGASRDVTRSLGDIADLFDQRWSDLADTAEQAAEDIFGPLERRAELSANRSAQGRQLGIIGDPKSTKDDIAAARQELLGLQKDFLTLTIDMAGRGELAAGELSKLTAALKDELKTATVEEAASINSLIIQLNRLRQAGSGLFGNFRGGLQQGDRSGTGSGFSGARAHGGPVNPFQTYLVNERGSGTEWLRMGSQSGSVSPTAPTAVSGTPAASTGSDPALLAEARLTNRLLARVVAQEPRTARPMTARGRLARDAALMPGGRL